MNKDKNKGVRVPLEKLEVLLEILWYKKITWTQFILEQIDRYIEENKAGITLRLKKS